MEVAHLAVAAATTSPINQHQNSEKNEAVVTTSRRLEVLHIFYPDCTQDFADLLIQHVVYRQMQHLRQLQVKDRFELPLLWYAAPCTCINVDKNCKVALGRMLLMFHLAMRACICLPVFHLFFCCVSRGQSS